MREKTFIFSFSVTLTFDLWTFAPPVTLIQRYGSTVYGFPISRKSEAKDRQTDGRGATLNTAPGETVPGETSPGETAPGRDA